MLGTVDTQSNVAVSGVGCIVKRGRELNICKRFLIGVVVAGEGIVVCADTSLMEHAGTFQHNKAVDDCRVDSFVADGASRR